MYENVPLWRALRDKADARNVAMVEEMVREAEALLLLVRDTFPTYTRHDARHAENVTRLMGELLGDQIKDLQALDAAMLILAAWFHDVGMVYTPAELSTLDKDEQFTLFLDKHPQAYNAVHANPGTVPPEVVEWYCRHRHADRVHVHLSARHARLIWSDIPISGELGEVCRSHNQAVDDLRAAAFDAPFLGECDLRLCALLLRMADILDFDRSRSPRAVYEHLGLAGRGSQRIATSDREWSKHLAANGFTFPAVRPPGYPLTFVAAPDKPSVEYDIRTFLDVVDDELRHCRQLLDLCSTSWRSLALPGAVDRRNIKSNGYTYGEFRFELDKESVLDLFVGERLYADQLAFVRELLQNAMDAVRLRQHLHGPVAGAAIEVSCWEDDAGFVWFRIDDPGIGMDEDSIQRYFLQVGRSYYRSAELEADLRRRDGTDRKFLAISRFGIGVLSCFLAGDLVEVSSRRIRSDGVREKAVRLTLDRSDPFFVLREDPKPAPPMPGPDPGHGGASGYRTEPGTSLAVRLDPARAEVSVAKLAERLASYVFMPPVPVRINGRPCGQAEATLLKPAIDAPIVVDIPPEDRVYDPRYSDELPYRGPATVVLLPIDLTTYSPTVDLRGQLLAVIVVPPDDAEVRDLLVGWPRSATRRLPARLREFLATCVVQQDIRINVGDGRMTIQVMRELDESIKDDVADAIRGSGRPRVRPADADAVTVDQVEQWAAGLTHDGFRGRTQNTSFRLDITKVAPGVAGPWLASIGVWWGHNGVSTTNAPTSAGPGHAALTWAGVGKWARSLVLLGPVSLQDRLRPEISISRDVLLSVPFEIRAAMQLAVRRACAPFLTDPAPAVRRAARRLTETTLIDDPSSERYSLAVVRQDPTFPEWADEALFIGLTRGGRAAKPLTAARLRQRVRESGPVRLTGPVLGVASRRTDFYETIWEAVAQVELDLAWSTSPGPQWYGRLDVRSDERAPMPPGLDLFPPLFFVPYVEGPGVLRHSPHAPLNRSHPMATWLIEVAPALLETLPAVLRQLRRALTSNPNVWPPESRVTGAEALERINESLAQAAKLRPDLAPPPEAYLTGSDNSGKLW